jgi:hypothetical protein
VDGVEHYQFTRGDGTDWAASREAVQVYLQIVFRCEFKYGESRSDDVDAEVFGLFCNVEWYLGSDYQKVAAFHLVFLQSDFDGCCSAHADQAQHGITFLILLVKMKEFEISLDSAVIVVNRYIHIRNFMRIYQISDNFDRIKPKSDGFSWKNPPLLQCSCERTFLHTHTIQF